MPHLLITDDEPAIRELVADIAVDEGYTVAHAAVRLLVVRVLAVELAVCREQRSGLGHVGELGAEGLL